MEKILKPETSVLYGALFGAVIGDLWPTPGDALMFYLTRKWRDQWTTGELTSKQFWAREAAGYYLLNSGWWALVGLVTYLTPGDYHKKLQTLLLLAGGGAVFAVLFKNIQKDEQEKLAEINKAKERLYKLENEKTT